MAPVSTGPPITCTYYPDQPDNPSEAGDPFPLDSSTLQDGDWVWAGCERLDTNELLPLFRTQIGGGLPLANPADLAQQALATIDFPTPHVQSWPPPDHIMVGLRTWFHVDEFGERTATAEVPGVRSTVTAVPDRVVWHLGTDRHGNPITLTCPTAGAVWRAGAVDDDTDCGHVFEDYSEGRTFTASVDVIYHVTWTSNLGVGGDLGEITATGEFPMRVWELQAVGR